MKPKSSPLSSHSEPTEGTSTSLEPTQKSIGKDASASSAWKRFEDRKTRLSIASIPSQKRVIEWPIILNLLLVVLSSFFLSLEAKAQNPTTKPKYEYSTPELKAAEALYKNKKYPEALAAFEDIIQKAQKAENYEEVVYAMEKKALSLRRLDNYERAIQIMDEAITLALERLPKRHLLTSRVYYTRGTTDHILNNFYSGKVFFDMASKYYKNALTYDSILHYRIAEYKYYAYQYTEASSDTLLVHLDKLKELEEARQIKNPQPYRILKLLHAYIQIHIQNGDYEQALTHSIKAYKYVKENITNISTRYHSETLFFFARVLYAKKEYKKAIKIMEELFVVIDKSSPKELPEYYSFHNLMGSIHTAIKDYQKALPFLEEALKISKKVPKVSQKISEKRFLSIAKINLALCYKGLGDYDKYEKHIKMSLTESKKLLVMPNPKFGQIYYGLGNLNVYKKNWLIALTAYDSALRNSLIEYNRDIYSFPDLRKNHFSFGDIKIISKKATCLFYLSSTKDNPLNLLNIAEDYTQQIHSILTNRSTDFSTSEDKLFFNNSFKDLYQTGVHASFELYKRTNDTQYLDKGLTHMSRGKSQLFLEQMGDLESLRGREVPKELRLSFALASQKIDSLDIEVSTLLNIDPLDERLPPVLEERIQWNDQLDSMKKVVNALYKAPEKEVSVDIIRQQYNLNSDKAFVEFIDGDSLIFAIGVSGDKTSFRKVKKDESFKVAFTRLLKEVSVAPQGAYTEHLNNFGQSASTLYQFLVAPIVDDLGSVKELIIVPDGELTKLPFDLLISDWSGTETSFKELNYLLKEMNMTHLLSSKIEFDKESNSVGKGILGFGYVGEGFTDERAEMGNLPGALEEIDFLKAKFDGDYFTGEKGTKQEFLKQADDYDIIHLAIHGKSDSTNRFKSSLVFNGDKDYYLTSTDLYSTNLQSKLAVLSACETGVGQLSKGEGTFSIARGFAMAGVPAIVTTLWKVNDIAGAKITQAFYQGLEQGFNKDEALRKAKLSFLEQSNNITESPFYWGNYILIGDPVPIELKKKNSSIQWMILMGVLLLAVGVVVSKRRKKLSHAA